MQQEINEQAEINISSSNKTNMEPEKTKISIIGAGLVGSLAALHLAKKGYEINLYESRPDIRTLEIVKGRSINLALSFRGRSALAAVGLEETLLLQGVPMKGRMLHDINGHTTKLAYHPSEKKCIYSIGRTHINAVLLSECEKHPNVSLNFNHKLISAKFETGTVELLNNLTQKTISTNSDLIIGCDGAYSKIRREMTNISGFNYSQTYIEHGYIELCIPPVDGEYAMDPNYLHIWPRGIFMMIALPNYDKSWTVTIFMPFVNYESLTSPTEIISFFKKYFPDVLPLAGKFHIIKHFMSTKPQSLVSIKCSPYHVKKNVLILGDAAHAMVPFYGQGMNAGFEDCTILSNILNKKNVTLADALEEFSRIRCGSAHAMCDLAIYNYLEMRDLVTKKNYRFRRQIDHFLHQIMPNIWIPLYNSVSFSDMPYDQCIKNKAWQDEILKITFKFASFSVLIFLGIFIYFTIINV